MRSRTGKALAIIIDAGSGYCKFGWSSEDQPSGRIATFLEFGNMESPLLPRIHALFKTIYSTLDADPREHPLILTHPLTHLHGTEEAERRHCEMQELVHSSLFTKLGVPAVCTINQAALSLFQARLVSGVVVNIGFKTTTVVPLVQGQVLPGAVGLETVPLAAMRVTGVLHHLLQQAGTDCHNMFTIRTFKEELCCVRAPADAEGCPESASFTVPEWEGGGTYTLNSERFLAPEVLFTPSLFGLPGDGLPGVVCRSILKCREVLSRGGDGVGGDGGSGRQGGVAVDAGELREALRHVVVSGGTAAISGLAKRLHFELVRGLPKDLTADLQVHANPHGYNCPWVGAKLLAQASNFPGQWCLSREAFLGGHQGGQGGWQRSCSPAEDVRLKLRRW